MAPPNVFFFRGIYGLDCNSCGDCSDFLAIDDGNEVTPQSSCGCCHHALSEHNPPPLPRDAAAAPVDSTPILKTEDGGDTQETAPNEEEGLASLRPANLNDDMNAEAGILQDNMKKRKASTEIIREVAQVDVDTEGTVDTEPQTEEEDQHVVAGVSG